MKIDFKDIVKLQKLYIEIFEEEDGYPVDGRIIANKEKAQQRILSKITEDTILQNKIISAIGRGSWNSNDYTFKPICDELRELGFEITGGKEWKEE